MYLNILRKLHPGNLRELKLGRISDGAPGRKEMAKDYSDLTIYNGNHVMRRILVDWSGK